jgi:transposase
MSYWSQPVETRDQLVLFPHRLEESIPASHSVRLLDEILGQLDWSGFEALYHGMRGQPPIHPRILSGVILYGLMTRIRSTRMLEDALQIRLDFRWLAEGRSIDHSTLSKFRHERGEQLKRLFVQVGLVARQAGMLPLEMPTVVGAGPAHLPNFTLGKRNWPPSTRNWNSGWRRRMLAMPSSILNETLSMKNSPKPLNGRRSSKRRWRNWLAWKRLERLFPAVCR